MQASSIKRNFITWPGQRVRWAGLEWTRLWLETPCRSEECNPLSIDSANIDGHRKPFTRRAMELGSDPFYDFFSKLVDKVIWNKGDWLREEPLFFLLCLIHYILNFKYEGRGQSFLLNFKHSLLEFMTLQIINYEREMDFLFDVCGDIKSYALTCIPPRFMQHLLHKKIPKPVTPIPANKTHK